MNGKSDSVRVALQPLSSIGLSAGHPRPFARKDEKPIFYFRQALDRGGVEAKYGTGN
jgi:hypothetical protein